MVLGQQYSNLPVKDLCDFRVLERIATGKTTLSIMSLVGFYDILNYLGFVVVAYCILDAINTRHALRKHPSHPLVGSPSTLVPKFLLNLVYAWKSTDLAKEGYDKYRNNAFQ